MCARVGGANTTLFLAAHFAKRNTKFGGGEKKLESGSGGGEIRTHDTLSGMTVFKTVAFNRSATPPNYFSVPSS